MNIKESDFDLQHGFSWIVISDNDRDLTVQCCLKQRKDGNGYKKEINAGDCGHNWGICGDVNEVAFEKFGENRCMKALFAKSRENGIKIN